VWFFSQKEKTSKDANSRTCGPASPEVVEDRERRGVLSAIRIYQQLTNPRVMFRKCFCLPIANFRHAEEGRFLKPGQPSQEEANGDPGFWASRQERPVGSLHP